MRNVGAHRCAPVMPSVAELLRTYLSPGSRCLVAVSGGPDSVALLHVVKALPYRLVVGHVDHQLRANSARDAHFVRRLARQWDISCLVQRVNVKRYAALNHQGLEEAGRELRYRALLSMAQKSRSVAILTAHTANDQAETVLMNFFRGAGPTGLAGIAPRRSGSELKKIFIIRPFLGVKRAEVLSYMKAHRLTYRTDPSNKHLHFSRNRMRLSTLPYLEKSNPGLSERLAQGADIFRQEEDFWRELLAEELRKTVRKDGQRMVVVLPRLLRYHKALGRRILRHILPGVSFQDIEHVLTMARFSRPNGWRELSGSWRVKRDKKVLIVDKKRFG